MSELLVPELGDRLTAEQSESAAQQLGTAPRIGLAPRFIDDRLEAPEVGLFGRHVEHIAGRLRLDRRGAEQLAQRRHVSVQRRSRGRRWSVAPHRIDQFVRRHDVAGAEQQDRQQAALLWAPRRDVVAVGENRQRAEEAEFHLRVGANHVRRGRRR